jgi:hypothetical protein
MAVVIRSLNSSVENRAWGAGSRAADFSTRPQIVLQYYTPIERVFIFVQW